MDNFDRIIAALRRWLHSIGSDSAECTRAHSGSAGVPASVEAKAVGAPQVNLGSRVEELELIFSDHFDGDEIDDTKWFQDDFTENADHRTGYEFLELDGSVNKSMKFQVVAGRHAARMDKHRDKVQFIRRNDDGTSHLVFKPFVVKENNPHRKSFYAHGGKFVPAGDYLVYAPWLSTYQHKHEPKFTYGAGTVINVRINREKMLAHGCRHSNWTMPVKERAYKTITFAEIDHGETEGSSLSDFGNRILMKLVGGDAGDSKNGNINLLDRHGIDITKGWHDETLVWNKDGSTDFLVDGVQVNRDGRAVLMEGGLILSGEVSMGNKLYGSEDLQDGQNYSDGNPHQPVEVGLTAQCWFDSLEMLIAGEHEVLIDSVEAYKIL